MMNSPYHGALGIAKNIYTEGKRKGYEITSARTYLDGNGKENIETKMKTPYVDKNGSSVQGYAVVPIFHVKGLRYANTVEFYIDEHNVDYMNPKDAQMFDTKGNVVDLEKAREEMRQFAAAGSEYPHVASYNEWKALTDARCQRFKLDAPTAADYDVYLDGIQRQMASNDVTFVGQITSRSDLSMARATNPSFNAPMDEFQQEDTSFEYE